MLCLPCVGDRRASDALLLARLNQLLVCGAPSPPAQKVKPWDGTVFTVYNGFHGFSNPGCTLPRFGYTVWLHGLPVRFRAACFELGLSIQSMKGNRLA